MLGFFGIVLNKNTIANTAQIIQEIKPGEKYLVSFLNPPPSMRVVNIEEIQMWLLFPDKESGEAWVAANSQQEMDLGAAAGMTPPAPAEDKEPADEPGVDRIKKALEEGKNAQKN